MRGPTPPRSPRRRAAALVAALLAAGALAFLSTFRASPLAPPPPFAGPLPAASPPPSMRLSRLDTGVTHRSAAFAYRGGSFSDARDFAMTAVLVRHPRGDVLVDAGFGRDVDEHLRAMPAAFRAITRYAKATPAAEQLARAGYDRGRLRAILLTHAHWDHASGLRDFPDVPVWVTAEERRFVEEGGALAAVARLTPLARYEVYGFEGGPYLGFPRSHDVWGDGSLVVVPAPGHTPGSVIVFVTLPPGDAGSRWAFVGDLAWQREGITELEERPWLQRSLGDDDPAGVREGLLRMHAIHQAFPALHLVPAHDARAFEPLPAGL